MEKHLSPSHSECELVSDDAKELSQHKQLPTEGSKTKKMTGSHHQRMSDSPKRKLRSYAGEELREMSEEDGRGQKRVRTGLEQDKAPAADSAPPKSKEYVAEGAEHIYRTHTCLTCRRCFKMRSHLQEHLHLHFPDPSLQCPVCKRHFTSKSKLRVHRLREAGQKIHRCHLCKYSAVERNAIRRHVASMHADQVQDGTTGSFPCPSCGESFHQSRQLKAHMKTHNVQTAGRPVACFQADCPFQSSLRKELLRHTEEVHGIKAVECRHHACAAIFPTDTLMEIHYLTHLPYHCSLCHFSSSNKTLYLQHQRLGHAGSDELCCHFCDFITLNSVEFEQHVGRLHANEKIHHCTQCGYMTSHKRGLKRHMLMHSGEKPHKCTVCDFRCRDESYLSRHMLTHSTDKNFMCADCGYITKWKHYLNVHMRKHAGDLRYQCDQCPYRCHRVDQLNSHKLRHQAKSLMCEICGYACKRKYELRNHMLAKHSGGEKPSSVYKCKYCTYTTCYRQALQNHENCKHTKRREFRCALCPYTCFSGVSLFLHKRKTHGYVPGDKAWLENYAAKEREMNSTDPMEDFYSKRSAAGGQTEEPTVSQTGEPQSLCAVGVFDEVAHEVMAEGVSGRVNSPEEYCTLILTTLSTSDYQTSTLQHTDENCSNPTACCDSTQEKSNCSTPTNSLEEHNVAVHRDNGDLSDVDHSYEPLSISAGQLEEPGKCPSPQPNSKTVLSISPRTLSHQPSDHEVRLKAMKKHDKDQGEAMVLEGRVQMVVVPTKDKSTFVTSQEAGLMHHSEARTLRCIKDFKCAACGAQFKQRRSLHSHMAKKTCLARLRKTRTFVGTSKMCPTAEENCPNSAQSELPPQNTITTADQQEREEETQSEGCDDDVPSSFECQQSKTQKLVPSCVSLQEKALYIKTDGKFECKLCNFSSARLATFERHVGSCQKKLQKKAEDQCVNEFVAHTKDMLDEHNTAKKSNQKAVLVESHNSDCTKPKEHAASIKFKTKLLQCQLCTFTCQQKRCLAQHVALKHKGVNSIPSAITMRYPLKEHKSLQAGVDRHECDVCDKTLGSVTKLRQHKSRIHGKNPTHFCSLCDFSGYTLDDVRRHNVRCHTGELKHACGECDTCFSSESALRNHRKRAHVLQTWFPCTQCDYTCSSEPMLKAHQQRRHRLEKCTICHITFQSKEKLEIHQRNHLAHRCHLCPFAAKTKRLLAQHLASKHEEGSAEEKPLSCSMCEFSCHHQMVLEQHMRSHGGRRLYKCADCEYSTRNKQKITWHIRIHTGEKPYSCESCSYTCTDPSRLKLHMRVHQEERKYLCPECGYKCKWATQLKYHMTKHTGEKPYTCDECDYRTNRADALRAHRDTRHCETRPYVCEKCGKAFKTSFILKTHQRQHSDDRPYSCGLCQKSFRWPAGLRHHYLSHTKQQPFHCRHCSYTAKQKFQVVKHLRRHHPEVLPEEGVVKDAKAGGLRLREALQGMLDERAAEVEEEGIAGEDVGSEEGLHSVMKH